MIDKLQIEAVATFLIVFGAHMINLVIIKVKKINRTHYIDYRT